MRIPKQTRPSNREIGALGRGRKGRRSSCPDGKQNIALQSSSRGGERTRVYLDNNATSMVAPQVLEAMYKHFQAHYGNPSSLHQSGATASRAISDARARIAAVIGAKKDEIFFTSGGTESDNWAIRGVLGAQAPKRHVVTTAAEHLAVLTCCKWCQEAGCEVTVLGVDRFGRLNLDALRHSIREDTALVSIMWANNETGVFSPMDKIAEIVKAKGCLLHVDAVQVFGKVPVDLGALPIDLMSFSAHKVHGPKGIGGLYVRRGTAIEPTFYGGGQELGLRPGTENVPGIVGLGAAAALAAQSMQASAVRVQSMRDHLESEVLRMYHFATVNGDQRNRLPNTSNISFKGWKSRALLALLDRYGIEASSGSACCARGEGVSHVLLAMQVPPEQAIGAIRFSLSRFTSVDEVEYVLQVLSRILSAGRSTSG